MDSKTLYYYMVNKILLVNKNNAGVKLSKLFI